MLNLHFVYNKYTKKFGSVKEIFMFHHVFNV